AGVKAAADSKGLIPANGSRILGVGSGAGATESHNGSITTQKVPERVALATLYIGTTEYFRQRGK
ncbi:MAG: hypothetical protein HFI72_02160, partial [Peptococcaceae bacterium]|nr:hypothetical protein [Peptococcaceae bacterium]